MKLTYKKALVGTLAAGAMAVTSASPAMARDRGGIDAGDVIAGALIIGGIAAIASASRNDRYDDRYRGRYDNRYDRYDRYDRYNRYSPRQAVEECVYGAERTASRYSYGGGADVTDIRQVRETRNGYTVKGRIAVNTRGRNWRSGDGYYGRGWDRDYRGYNRSRHRGYDSGRFTCKVRNGRIVDLDYSGIRGL
jgi:hypothetical protein